MADLVEPGDLRIVPANQVTWQDLEAIFGTADYPFHCQCQRFKVTGWLWRDTTLDERLAMQRDRTACEQPGAEHTSGLVAFLDDEPVGWVAVEPRTAYPKLRSLRVPWTGRRAPLRAEIDVVGYVARKPPQVLTAPHFLQEPPPTPESEALCRDDIDELGFVMNVTRLWSQQPKVLDDFFDLAGRATTGRLSFRERGLIVLATASTIGDSYCSTAWAGKLTPDVGAQTAAAVLRGDDTDLTPTEQVMTTWIRRVMRSATTTTPDDIEALRQAGLDDDRIFAMTFYAAMRMAFSTVNKALGAHPDSQFRATVAPEVLAAVDYGRPMGPEPVA